MIPDPEELEYQIMSLEGELLGVCNELDRVREERDGALELEAFWRRVAEQALRLWDRAQDERDNLLDELDSCDTIGHVRDLVHDERTA